MIRLLILLAFACVAGCAGRNPAEHRTAPSVGPVKAEINRAQESNERASAHNERVLAAADRQAGGIDRSLTYAERIDHKATVILKYWPRR